MFQQESDQTSYKENASSTPSSSRIRQTNEQRNGGKLRNEVPSAHASQHGAPSPSDTNPFFEKSNPFLAPSTQPPQSHTRQRQEVPSHTSEVVEDNPFLVTSKPQSKSQSVTVTQPPRDNDNTDYQSRSSESSNSHRSSSQGARQQFSHAHSSNSKSSRDKSDYQNVTMEDLKRARMELKAWEADFKVTHQRAATQDDIAKDELMVKKYRAYGKIKKALAAKEAKKTGDTSNPSVSVTGFTDLSNSNEPPRTPSKQSRTHQSTAVTRTPTRKHEVEFVSPRKVVGSIGFMSPRKSKVTEDYSQSNSRNSSPSSQRIHNMLLSPSRNASRRSLIKSPSFQSPSSLFVIDETSKDDSDMAAPRPTNDNSLSVNDTMDGMASPGVTTPFQTPKSRKTSSLYLPNPFQSPTRSRISPLFGGMNNRKPKRIARVTAPVAEDLEPQVAQSQISKGSPIIRNDYDASDVLFARSPITSTPQKSGAAKAARSLFRRPSVSYPNSPSLDRSQSNLSMAGGSQAIPNSPSLNRTKHVYESKSVPSNPFQSSIAAGRKTESDSLQDSVHDALDSMSIQEHQRSPLRGRITQGFDIDDNGQSCSSTTPSFSTEIREGLRSRTPQELLSPSKSRSTYSYIIPRTPSQQPSLTFSQATPGSAKSEVDIMVVPAGFHSHYRRRHVRPMLFMPSQEEDEEFEREFLGSKANKQSVEKSYMLNTEDVGLDYDIRHAVDNNEAAHNSDSEDQQGGLDNQGETQHDSSRKAPSKKKYTQKRTTRLHRIAVAPSENTSEKAKAMRPIKTPRARRAAKPQADSDKPEADKEKASEEVTENAAHEAPENPQTPISSNTTEIAQTKANSTSKDESTAYGWANSNKPMVKSDRRMPGVGIGRAGPRRPTASKFGGPSSDGNFVAYNLQKGFKKGGARGKSRFGGSKFGGYGASTAATGRTLFDDESWRTEFDKDFDDETLAVAFADGNLEIEDDEEIDGDVPWYGNVNDVTDPYVVTVSKKYLKTQIGDIGDPEEYIKEQERMNQIDGVAEADYRGFRVNLDHILKKVWGYPSFREGQLDSIKRTLDYKSSLLVLPTGSGKSLSYQLPAYIFSKLGIPSLTLVISPMISLMYDQVKCLPPGLSGACWTSVEQTPSQFKDFMDKLTSNTIKILFISPEKLQSQSFLSLVRTRKIPPINFLCVDEVHCLSEWSHNFRPAYLLLNHVLKTDLKSPCVLGLTGTATEGTKDSICAMLDIDRTTGVLSGPVIRDNLAMTVSMEIDRETALLNLLQSPRFANMNSILIYVMKQAQADLLAGFLRVRNFSAESYHAGKSSLDRQRIQHRFMSDGPQKSIPGVKMGSSSISAGGSSNGIRILVATIAFGLGLNKSNIRSVIHYCMPKSLENYIQEIGRSGRDGEKAYCHMFLNQDDYLRLRSLAYADGMDWGSVLRLVKNLFSRRGISAVVPQKKGTTGVSSRKRRGLAKDNETDEDSDEQVSQGESPDRTSAKKLKQNDHQALNIKASKPGNSSVINHRNLVMSTASILVIPPTPDMLLDNNAAYRKRLVVVREELIEDEFDIKKEVLATLLSYIELDSCHPIKVLGSISAKCTIKFLYASEALSELADNVPLIDAIMKQGVLTGNNPNKGSSSSYGKGRKYGNRTGLAGTTLSMAYCCDTMSLCQQSNMTYTEFVQEMQLWKRKKWIVFELTDSALCIEILKEPADCMIEYRRQQQELDMDIDGDVELSYEENHDDFITSITDRLHRKLCAVERVGVAKVDQVYELFQAVATPTWQQQEVFQARSQDSEDEDSIDEIRDEGDESSEYDEDADEDYIQMRARAKALAKAKSKKKRLSGIDNGVSESEMILRNGIQEYFAKRSGEGIGGPGAEEKLFQIQPGCGTEDPENATSSLSVAADKTIQMYTYENATVANLQRKWRSAVEVDLKVFLNQHWQHRQQQESSDYGDSGVKAIDSPRVVSRIFHGVSSPCYSALEWSKTKYWAKYVHFDFAQLMQMADRIIKGQRQQRLSQK